ncbi:hypothetical protein LUZ61_016036 [Rhynchospora tenuis]|uniref:Inosine/uridine-preferring nucleoside hydrolase domain-containing protein n=1 Tax=Rhynchospora tenuis TaxID=198213 RepID=A0AAD5Z4R4_9POAL|nr:hypothetical protein LUZ61_016036 [Rhynchospora tenuis]
MNDGSNPFVDGHQKPRFNLQQGDVHSGHVQNGIDDPFCIVNGSTKGKCEVLNLPQYAGRFNIRVSGNGWADAATIDIIYDALHMMGRDNIPVGLGNLTALGTPSLSCTYFKAIPLGSSGYIDSDSLYGLARDLPRSPRRYTAENSVKYGAPRDTDHPEHRQKLAFEVWESVTQKLSPGEKIFFLTNGPLTNLATIILSDTEATSKIESIVIVGGHVASNSGDKGNVYTVPSNNYAEFNFFLDPRAAKTVVQSGIKTTLVPLVAQRKVASFDCILQSLQLINKTPELDFAYKLLSLMNELQRKHQDIFLGEILGSVFLVEQANLKPIIRVKQIDVIVGDNRNEGQLVVDNVKGKLVNILESLDTEAYFTKFACALSQQKQTAVISSFDEQKKLWSKPPA